MTTKPIQMLFKVKFANLRNEVEIKKKKKKNYAITWMSNSEVLQKLVAAEQKAGSKMALAYDNHGKLIAIQKYPGMDAKEIAKKIKNELEKSTGGNLKTL